MVTTSSADNWGSSIDSLSRTCCAGARSKCPVFPYVVIWREAEVLPLFSAKQVMGNFVVKGVTGW